MLIKKLSLETGKAEECLTSDFLKYINNASTEVVKTFWVKLRRSNEVNYMLHIYTFPVPFVTNILRYLTLTLQERGEKINDNIC